MNKWLLVLCVMILPMVVSCGSDENVPGNCDHLRLMTGNLTSGSQQTYDPGHGKRIFEAMKPDVLMIQEFNYNGGEMRDFVTGTFGDEYVFYRGTAVEGSAASIPNGIISRYPIVKSGQWASEEYQDRQYAWAVIDIPGNRDLLAVSVHLHTANHGSEMTPLVEKIANIQKEGGYYVVLSGDFNTKDAGGNMRATVTENAQMKSMFATGGPYPVDQNGNESTNRPRTAPLDWVLLDKDLSRYEVPVTIGTHSYRHGHVFDSRVYGELGEIGDVPPVLETDSDAASMQHMGVIRDVCVPVDG